MPNRLQARSRIRRLLSYKLSFFLLKRMSDLEDRTKSTERGSKKHRGRTAGNKAAGLSPHAGTGKTCSLAFRMAMKQGLLWVSSFPSFRMTASVVEILACVTTECWLYGHKGEQTACLSSQAFRYRGVIVKELYQGTTPTESYLHADVT